MSWTGGSIFLKSTLNRLDEFQNKTTAYSSQPLVVGYEQSLFGYNSLKWDMRIEPIRYREAKKQYAETLEIISATACNYFFSLASAQTELEMARQNFASADTLYSMAQGRYKIGTITENEMLQLEINRLNEETNVLDAEINLREVMQSVRSFLGLEQDVALKLIMPDSVPDFNVPLDLAIELALQNSPDPDYYRRIVKESESYLAQAKANSGLRADLYVQFGLSQTGRNISASYRSPQSQEYASISLSLPILDWGRGKGRVRVAKSQLALTHTQAEQGMNDFRQNVEKLVLQLDKSLQQCREEYRMGIKNKAELEVVEEDYEYQHRKAELQMESLHHDSKAAQLKREMLAANRTSSGKRLSRSVSRTEQLVVRATASGQLSFLNATIGQQLAAGSNVCSIKVLSDYKVHTSLSEYYIDRITTGLPAHIQYQNTKFPLRISKVVPEVSERAFPCDLVFTGKKPSNIRLGKSYRVQIELGKPETSLTIPRGDFYQATSGRWIYRLSPDGKTARRVNIEIGRQNPQQYEILSGLKPGDHVIINGYDKLGDVEELVIK